MYAGKQNFDATLSDGVRECRLTSRHYQAIMTAANILRNYLTIEYILLYGSCARSEASFGSDVDLYVVVPEINDAAKRSFRDARAAVETAVDDIDIDIHFGTERELNDGSTYHVAILKEGIKIR